MQRGHTRLRFILWFAKRLTTRYWRVFISSFIVGLLLVLLSIQVYPTVASFALKQEKVIGIVGVHTPSDLPLPIQNLISIGLVGVTASGEPAPALASEWETLDGGKRYIFHLLQDVVWHDGDQLSADDVNYNLRDVTITPLDAQTLEVTLLEPFSPLPILLSKPLFRTGLVGLGAYEVASIRLKGDSVTFLRLVPAQPDSDLEPLTVKFYPSEEAAKMGFILGEVNTLDNIIDPTPFVDWEQVSIRETTKFNQYIGLFFNMNHSLLSEKSMRQALALALDEQGEEQLLTPLSIQSWAYTNNVRQYSIDLATAQETLNTVLSATESAELTISTFHEYLDLAQQIADSWEKLETVSVKVKLESRLPEDFQILLASQEIPPDPDQYPFWHSTQQQTNFTGYSNPRIDKLLEDGRQELDPSKRKRIYAEFQRNLVEDLPAIFLFHPTLYTISRE